MTSHEGHAKRDDPDPVESAVSQQPILITTVDRGTTDQHTRPLEDPALPHEKHPLISPDFKGNFGPTPPGPIMHAP